MTEASAFHTPPSDDEAERKQASILPAEPENEEARARPWPSLSNLQDRLARFQKSAAGRYWRHLSPADFMNSSFAFSALAVLSAFPFLAVSSAVVGGDIRTAIVARMGLNAQASRDINGLIATGNQAVATLTWFSAIVLVLGGIGMASTCRRGTTESPSNAPEGLPRALRLSVGRGRG